MYFCHVIGSSFTKDDWFYIIFMRNEIFLL